MFTGLVTDIGTLAAVEDRGEVRRLTVESAYSPERISLGASIMHAGVCLTVVAHGERAEGGSWWAVEAVPETLSRTTLGGLHPGDRMNLELSLRMGDELGGHFVFGHVDGLGTIAAITPQGEGGWRVAIDAPPALAPLLAEKGSIAVDGISLTVASVAGSRFELAIIPHTWAVTTLGHGRVGQQVNLEADMLARYVARLLGKL